MDSEQRGRVREGSCDLGAVEIDASDIVLDAEARLFLPDVRGQLVAE